jgi:hypothetical protein
VILPPFRRDFRDINVFFELMDTDLHQVIKANDDLTKEHHQFFLYQMLLGLKYIHTVMHIHGNIYFHMKGILSSLHFICALWSCAQGLKKLEQYRFSKPTKTGNRFATIISFGFY